MRRFKTSLASATALVLFSGSNALFAQVEDAEVTQADKQAPATELAESTTQPDEPSAPATQTDSKPAKVEVSEAALAEDDTTGDTTKLVAPPKASPSDNASQKTDKPNTARPQTAKPTAAADTKPGRFALTFDDLKFEMEKSETFDREMLTNKINGYHGGKVKIRGYIRPNFKQSGITKFIFVRDNKECCFGPQAAIFDNILVRLERGNSANYTVRPVTIEGDFVLKEYHGDDGNVWSLYRMYNAKIK